jgi:hypothetical protein
MTDTHDDSCERIRLQEVIEKWRGLSEYGKALYAPAIVPQEFADNPEELLKLSDREIAEFFSYRNESLFAIGVKTLDFADEISHVEHLGDLILAGAVQEMVIDLKAMVDIGRRRNQIVDGLPIMPAAYQVASVIRGVVSDLGLLHDFAKENPANCLVFAGFTTEPTEEFRNRIKQELKAQGVRSQKIRIEDVDAQDLEHLLKIKTLTKPVATYISEWLMSRPITIHARAHVMRPYKPEALGHLMGIDIS